MIAFGVLLLLILLRLRRGKPGPSPLAKVAEARRLEKETARGAEASVSTHTNDAREKIWLHPLGFVARLVVYAALFGLLYLYAPNDISNIPLARLTLHDILGTVFMVVAFLALIRALFNPSEDDEIKNAWGWIGVLIVCGAVLAAFFGLATTIDFVHYAGTLLTGMEK